MKKFFFKLKGASLPPPRAGWREILWGMIGSGLALFIIGLLHRYTVAETGLPLLMFPLGASAVLVFGIPRSALAQPRNVVGGHTLSALVGITVFQLLHGAGDLVCASLAVCLAIGLMHATKTLHPPGGATAFMAAAGGPCIHAMGYWYALSPCFAGSLLMVLIALVINNLALRQHYPLFW